MVIKSCKLFAEVYRRKCIKRLLHSLFVNSAAALFCNINQLQKNILLTSQAINNRPWKIMDFCEMSSTTCHSPDWLTKAFIQETLRIGYKDTSLCIANLKVTPVTSPGDNYVSELYRLSIEVASNGKISDNGSKRRSVIIKCLPTAEYNLKFICDARLFEKEISVYTETLPAMGVTCLAPQCFYTRDDMLMLEDLSPLGFKMMNRRRGLDLDHCQAAVRALARLHASSVQLPASELAARYPETVYHDYDHAQRYIQHSLTSLATVMEDWEMEYRPYAAVVRRLSATVLNDLLALMPREAPTADEDLYVLNHGDFWSNNIMFRYDAEEHIHEVRLLDFQMCRYARLTLDLQYFLHTSLCLDLQTSSVEDLLLATYHAEFCRLAPRRVLSLTRLREDMRLTRMFGLVNACMMLPVVLSDPAQDSPDLGGVAEREGVFVWHQGAQFGRHFRAILDRCREEGMFRDT